MDTKKIHIGTCSWRYESWEGLVYSKKKPGNYLAEYSQKYKTVEVDQWFWSLFNTDNPVLPKPSVVQEYADSTPDDFIFCIKIPNSITLTHHYKKKKTDPLQPNPHFFSVELMEKFLERLDPLKEKIGPLIFQFEYLNKQKMKGSTEFLDQLEKFVKGLPAGYDYFIETRNPNYLSNKFFEKLIDLDLHYVFLQGYFMPSIFDVYRKYRDLIKGSTVIRLHGPDRKEIEKKTGNDWSQVVAPKEKDLESLSEMLKDFEERQMETFYLHQ